MIQRDQITALILAGGRGSRMGGVDKGLQLLDGEPLVQHAMRRIAPQAGSVMISANRHAEVYRGYGVPVLPDADTDYPGPLAGFLAGLDHCRTAWLVTVPCDTPRFPADLVAALTAGVGEAPAAVAVTKESGELRRQSVFCLLRADVRADLIDYMASGGRKVERWLEHLGCVDVPFDDADAFFNANTPDELRRLGSA